MRGQTNIISIIIIAGIIVALVGVAYSWSIPLLSKGEAQTTFQTATDFILALNKQIVDIANSGGGEGSLDIPLGQVQIIPFGSNDPRNNSIIYQFTVPQPLALNSSKTYIGGASYVDIANPTKGIFGESTPTIVSLEVNPQGTAYVATVQIVFRELVSKSPAIKGREIVLNQNTPNQILTGKSKITFAFNRNIDQGQILLTNMAIGLV